MTMWALFSAAGGEFFLRWMHYFVGIIWIGLLYYFNFVQTPFLAETDAATKSGVIQKLVPRALTWFRWGAMFTFLTGVLLIGHKWGSLGIPLTSPWGTLILTGSILGTIMFLNVWLIIWPNQKIVIESATRVARGESALPEAAQSGARAGVASRTNALFSLPMLFFMGAASHLPIAMSSETSLVPYWSVFAIVIGLIEMNAIKGKLGPLATIKGVVHLGLALALLLYVLAEVLTK